MARRPYPALDGMRNVQRLLKRKIPASETSISMRSSTIASFVNWTKAAFSSGRMGNESVTKRFKRSRIKDHLLA